MSTFEGAGSDSEGREELRFEDIQLINELVDAEVPEHSPPRDGFHHIWQLLWSIYCHQDTSISTDSYAAVPHLVDSCEQAKVQVKPHILELVAHIQWHHQAGAAPELAEHLRESYEDALARARKQLGLCVMHSWPPKIVRKLAKILLMLSGERTLGDFLCEADHQWPECPACHAEIFNNTNDFFKREW